MAEPRSNLRLQRREEVKGFESCPIAAEIPAAIRTFRQKQTNKYNPFGFRSHIPKASYPIHTGDQVVNFSPCSGRFQGADRTRERDRQCEKRRVMQKKVWALGRREGQRNFSGRPEKWAPSSQSSSSPSHTDEITSLASTSTTRSTTSSSSSSNWCLCMTAILLLDVFHFVWPPSLTIISCFFPPEFSLLIISISKKKSIFLFPFIFMNIYLKLNYLKIY